MTFPMLLFAFTAVLRIPECQFALGDGTFIPDPCRYYFARGGEFLVVRRPNVPSVR